MKGIIRVTDKQPLKKVRSLQKYNKTKYSSKAYNISNMSCRYISSPAGIHRNSLRRTARLADISLSKCRGDVNATQLFFVYLFFISIRNIF